MVVAKIIFIDVHDATELMGKFLFGEKWYAQTKELLNLKLDRDRHRKRRGGSQPKNTLLPAQLKQIAIEIRHLIASEELRAYYLGNEGEDDWRPFDPSIARSARFQLDLANKFISGREGALEYEFCLNKDDLLRTINRGKAGRPRHIDLKQMTIDAEECLKQIEKPKQAALIKCIMDKQSVRSTDGEGSASESTVKNFVRVFMAKKGFKKPKR